MSVLFPLPIDLQTTEAIELVKPSGEKSIFQSILNVLLNSDQYDKANIVSQNYSIKVHHLGKIIAVLFEKTIFIIPIELSKIDKSSPLIIKSNRLLGDPICIEWSTDQQYSLLVGTTNGVNQITIPSLRSNQLDTTNIDIKTIKFESHTTFPILMISSSPTGRYFVAISSKVPGKLIISDAWLDSHFYIKCYDCSLSVDNLIWSKDGNTIIMSANDGSIVLLETYRWEFQSFGIVAKSSVKLCCTSDQTIFCAPLQSMDIYRFYISSILTEKENQTVSKISSSPFNLTNSRRDCNIKDIKVNRNGNLLAFTFIGKDLTPSNEVDIYLYHKSQYLSFTFIKTIRREDSGANVNTKIPFPLTIELLTLPSSDKKIDSVDLLIILWSDNFLSYHSL